MNEGHGSAVRRCRGAGRVPLLFVFAIHQVTPRSRQVLASGVRVYPFVSGTRHRFLLVVIWCLFCPVRLVFLASTLGPRVPWLAPYSMSRVSSHSFRLRYSLKLSGVRSRPVTIPQHD